MSLRSERGSALLLTIVVILVLLVLGGALGMYSLVERVQVEREINDMQAYYLARSGAEALKFAMLERPEKIPLLLNEECKAELEGVGTFTVQVTELITINDPRRFELISTGMFRGREQVHKTTFTLGKEGASDHDSRSRPGN